MTTEAQELQARASTLTDDELEAAKAAAYAAQREAERVYLDARTVAKAAMAAAIKTEADAQTAAQTAYNILSHEALERGRGEPVTWQAISAVLRRAGIPRAEDKWSTPKAGQHSTSKRSDYAVDVTMGGGSTDEQTLRAETALASAGYSILSYHGRRVMRVVRLKPGQTVEDLRRRNANGASG